MAHPRPSAWISRPWVDLTVGCGAWSAPLLLLVYLLAAPDAGLWALAFYALALVFNYPHFMATIYRAYAHERDFVKYRTFTVHLTALLAATGVLVHLFPAAAMPWLFTVYITWSPWHYTGQNYGLLMMFARRNGATPTAAERRALYGAFVASYVMLLLSFHSGPSDDPLVISLGVPRAGATAGQLSAAVVFALAGGWALWRLARRLGFEAMTAPLTLFVTQLLWFVLPTALEMGAGTGVPQTRYSTGILAVLHSTQYLWITSYYARREALADGQAPWRPVRYFLVLIVGGIALFIPGPWVVSYLFRYDFATSFLVFTALVNIHHFMLDGAIWKLRDGRIASLLLNTRDGALATTRDVASRVGRAVAWATGRTRSACWTRRAAVALLLLTAGLDQTRHYLALDPGNLTRVQAAVRLNQYDPAAQTNLALGLVRAGETSRAEAVLREAIALNPSEARAQRALGRLLVENERIDEAYVHYRAMVAATPDDPDAFVNLGILANGRGNADEAVAAWRTAIAIDPLQARAHLYAADALDRSGDFEEALPHFRAYLALVAASRGASRPEPAMVIDVLLRYADAETRSGHSDEAIRLYEAAIDMAGRTGESALGDLATERRDALGTDAVTPDDSPPGR